MSLPKGSELLAVLDSDQAVGNAAAVWSRVVHSTNASLLAFEDSRLKHWFRIHGESSHPNREIRFVLDRGAIAYGVDSHGKASILPGGWVVCDFRNGSHRYLVRCPIKGDFAVEGRQSSRSAHLAKSAAIQAAPINDLDRKIFEAAADLKGGRSVNLLFDSDDAPGESKATWHLASIAAGPTSAVSADAIIKLRAIGDPKNEMCAALIIASRPIASPHEPRDRIVLFGLASNGDSLNWSLGDTLQIGRVDASWGIEFDLLEDRWSVSIGAQGGGPTITTTLNRVPIQRLPLLSTSQGKTWATYLLLFEL